MVHKLRKHFEKREGYCDYCNRELKKYTINSSIFRYNVNGLIICCRCFGRYNKSNQLEYKPRTKMSDEEIKKRRKLYADVRYSRETMIRKQERLMSPDELLKIVREKHGLGEDNVDTRRND